MRRKLCREPVGASITDLRNITCHETERLPYNLEESKQILAKRPMPKKFDFVYYTFAEILVGDLGGKSFIIPAVSGGGRGGQEPEATFASYNAHRATKKVRGITQRRGGSLPPGLWQIEKPSVYRGKFRKPVAKLAPIGIQREEFPTRDYNKEPFLIHGPGDKGSDGCIVIGRVNRKRLLDAIEGAGGAILLVSNMLQPGDVLDKPLRRVYTA
jgi:hypothetical protein